MFKLRLLSTLILLPLVIAGILWLPNIYIAIGSGIVFALGAWEWINMTVIKHIALRIVLLLLLILVAFCLLHSGLDKAWVYGLSVIWWIFGFIGICYYPLGERVWRDVLLQPFVGLILFVPAWIAFNQLHALPNGPRWVLLACALIWGADISAYCAGKLWGKAKLIEHVSPGKTWVGFYAALVSGGVIMSAYYWIYKPNFSYIHALWLGLFTVLFAVIGDLVESLFKRVYKVKDSGKLIPGHGGAFDRIDSMLAGLPIFVLGLHILQTQRIFDGF